MHACTRNLWDRVREFNPVLNVEGMAWGTSIGTAADQIMTNAAVALVLPTGARQACPTQPAVVAAPGAGAERAVPGGAPCLCLGARLT